MRCKRLDRVLRYEVSKDWSLKVCKVLDFRGKVWVILERLGVLVLWIH